MPTINRRTTLSSKGENFAVTFKEIPIEEVVANIQEAIGISTGIQAQDNRNETAPIWGQTKPQKGILILLAEKGIAYRHTEHHILRQ